jgi:hypothetical protein
MERVRSLCLSLLCAVFTSMSLHAQWNTVLSTQDDTPNGTGHQTISVAVINAKCFVALINRPIMKSWTDDVTLNDSSATNYLVGYSNPTDLTGRVDRVPYGSTPTLGLYTKWISGFDEIKLWRAYKVVGTADSLVYLANNDPDHNILVFKLMKDTTGSTDYRMKTGTEDIHGLAVDNNGYVYVCALMGTTANTKEIKVFKGIKTAGTKWATTYDDAPVATIDLPVGVYRGLAVSGDGKQLFVSNMVDRTVTKFTGSPATGYVKATGFSFTESKNDTIPGTKYDTLGTSAWDIGRPLGMAYLNGNNILYVATARLFANTIKAHNASSAYSYSKIIGLNPLTGKAIDSVDIAKYNYEKSDTTGVSRSYTVSHWGDGLHTSGYASSYDVGFDEQKNLYTQSFYSWTIEEWKHTGALPVTTSVSRGGDGLPAGYALSANYPNPFNPATTFNVSIPEARYVTVKVFDLLGREVASLIDGMMQPGTYSVVWNASASPSGVYMCRLQAGSFTATNKLTLMK